MSNRVTVDLVVGDAVSIRRVAELVDDAGTLLVFGVHPVVAGS